MTKNVDFPKIIYCQDFINIGKFNYSLHRGLFKLFINWFDKFAVIQILAEIFYSIKRKQRTKTAKPVSNGLMDLFKRPQLKEKLRFTWNHQGFKTKSKREIWFILWKVFLAKLSEFERLFTINFFQGVHIYWENWSKCKYFNSMCRHLFS